MKVEMDREVAENLVSILNYLWSTYPYVLGDVEDTGFGFTTPVSDDSKVIELNMADGSRFEDGVKDLWTSICR